MALYGYARVSTSDQDLTLQTQFSALLVVKSFVQKKPAETAGPEGMLLVVRVKECGESECRSVMKRTEIEPPSNIISRESGLTSTWSFIAR